MDFSEENFSQNEWESCLKVLSALKDDPFLNPDNKIFSGLITKIHKNAKKQNRQENYSEMKNHDLEVNSESVLMKKALAGVSVFYDDEKNDTQLTRLQIPKNCYCCNQNGDNSLSGKIYSLHGIDASSNLAYLPKQKR